MAVVPLSGTGTNFRTSTTGTVKPLLEGGITEAGTMPSPLRVQTGRNRRIQFLDRSVSV
jgi:hypothetical protein